MFDPGDLREQADHCDRLRAGYTLAGDTSHSVTLLHLSLHLRRSVELIERYAKELANERPDFARAG